MNVDNGEKQGFVCWKSRSNKKKPHHYGVTEELVTDSRGKAAFWVVWDDNKSFDVLKVQQFAKVATDSTSGNATNDSATHAVSATESLQDTSKAVQGLSLNSNSNKDGDKNNSLASSSRLSINSQT